MSEAGESRQHLRSQSPLDLGSGANACTFARWWRVVFVSLSLSRLMIVSRLLFGDEVVVTLLEIGDRPGQIDGRRCCWSDEHQRQHHDFPLNFTIYPAPSQMRHSLYNVLNLLRR